MDLKQLLSPSNFKSIMTKAQTHPYIKPIEKKKKMLFYVGFNQLNWLGLLLSNLEFKLQALTKPIGV